MSHSLWFGIERSKQHPPVGLSLARAPKQQDQEIEQAVQKGHDNQDAKVLARLHIEQVVFLFETKLVSPYLRKAALRQTSRM